MLKKELTSVAFSYFDNQIVLNLAILEQYLYKYTELIKLITGFAQSDSISLLISG